MLDQPIRLEVTAAISVSQLVIALHKLTESHLAKDQVSLADADAIISCGQTLRAIAQRERDRRHAEDHQR